MKTVLSVCFLTLFFGAVGPPGSAGTPRHVPQTRNHWTIMHYGGLDNNNSEMVVPFYQQMKAGLVDGQGVELIALADRNPKYTSETAVFGETFADTRLYRFARGRTERLSGGNEFPEITTTSNFEANTADVATLRKFIRFCKAHYPAEHYALIVFTHGSGFAFSPDERHPGDGIYTAQLTDALTSEDSVDLLGFDVCLMGGVENMYQWRPGNGSFSAEVVVASAPSTGPWPYEKILGRLHSKGTNNGTTAGNGSVDPATLSAGDFAGVIIDELRNAQPQESWASYDLTRVEDVKRQVDALARGLAAGNLKREIEDIRGRGCVLKTLNYLGDLMLGWAFFPYFDLYDLARNVKGDPRFGAVRAEADRVMAAADAMVLDSFGGADYPGFDRGRHGLYIVFPDGDRVLPQSKVSYWALAAWYSPLIVRTAPFAWPPKELKGVEEFKRFTAYGKYAWCKDGAIAGNGKVENWFEVLDSWYDKSNGPEGGVNGYRW